MENVDWPHNGQICDGEAEQCVACEDMNCRLCF